MKNLFFLATAAVLIGSLGAAGQEKSADPTIVPVSFPAQPWSYSPNDIKILGTLDDGQTSKPAVYSSTPKYRAFVFEGNGRDQVEITVTGGRGKAYVALADSTLTPIASGIGRLTVTLPYHGPDLEAFYILVKNLSNPPGELAIHLKKAPGSAQPADATR